MKQDEKQQTESNALDRKRQCVEYRKVNWIVRGKDGINDAIILSDGTQKEVTK